MAERLDPRVIFELIAAHVPSDLKGNTLIVGSLAAAYHHREQLQGGGVTTKDADVVIQPAGAIEECKAIAMRLAEEKWRKRIDPKFPPRPTPDGNLPAIRLSPPMTDAYFIELLGFPAAGQRELKTWEPVQLDDGWYGLPSFRFLGLTAHGRQSAEGGLTYAAPSMMALANLLSHPFIRPERMESEPIGGRSVLRSAKDLGRVLALARLSSVDEIAAWADEWRGALRATFPNEYTELALHAGDGLRELLERADALDEARHAADVGLLAGYQISNDEMRVLADQVIALALRPLAEEAGG